MLNKPNPCEGFARGWENRKVYEANGCDKKKNCKKLDGDQDRKLNRRIQLAVYLNDEGIMHYKVGVHCINGGNDKKGCDDKVRRRRRLFESLKFFTKKSANQRRRRLLYNGGGRC